VTVRRLALGIALLLAPLPALAGHGASGLVPGYRAEHVKRLLDAGERLVLVDLRSAPEFGKGRLPGARSIPLADLERRAAEVPRSGRVILYGETIIEASEAAKLLEPLGYRNIGVLEDGFKGWVAVGLPVERGR
jgi:ArsR family transcriptional regulator